MVKWYLFLYNAKGIGMLVRTHHFSFKIIIDSQKFAKIVQRPSEPFTQFSPILVSYTSLVAQTVKSLPTIWETWVQSLDQEDPLEKETATCSSNLA